MKYTIFNKTHNDQLEEPMFLGQSVNVARFDQQRYPIFDKISDRQLAQFWRPEEVDVSRDARDFKNIPENEQHIFVSNIKYQTLLDSIQGRSPVAALLPLSSIPELETWIQIWSAFESGIHAKSYTHIIRNIFANPAVVFDDIMDNEHIIKRSTMTAKYYDDLIEYGQMYNLFGEGTHVVDGKEYDITKPELMRRIILCLIAVHVLENLQFQISFACSFAFGERKLMEGNAKIIKFIARDEALHASSTAHMLNIIRKGKDGQEWADIYEECKPEAIEIFKNIAEQEIEWAEYLFKDGSMIGLNVEILSSYMKYLTNSRMRGVGLESLYPEYTQNPIPWIKSWLISDDVQVAPQETEISSYLVGQIDSKVDVGDLDVEF